MADALDLGSSFVRSAGSSPVSCTILNRFPGNAPQILRHIHIEVNVEIRKSR